jgi:hypothetical protein
MFPINPNRRMADLGMGCDEVAVPQIHCVDEWQEWWWW